MMRAACAIKIACGNLKQKSYRVNWPFEYLTTLAELRIWLHCQIRELETFSTRNVVVWKSFQMNQKNLCILEA